MTEASPPKPKAAEPAEQKPIAVVGGNQAAGQSAFAQSMVFEARDKAPLALSLIKVVFLAIAIIIPALLAFYYGYFATDRYVSQAQFSVRAGTQQSAIPDILGGATGIPSAAGMLGAFQDAFVLREFVHSQELVDRIDRELGLATLFAKPSVDWWSRLDADATREEKHTYWQWRVSADLDAATGLVTIKAAAFSPDESLQLVQAILQACRELVNRLSVEARRDALTFANTELAQAERRLVEARNAVTRFRNTSGDLFPDESAKAQLKLIAELEFSVVQAKAELAAQGIAKQGPAQRAARARIEALEDQIALERAKLTSTAAHGSSGDPMSEVLISYQALEANRIFAEEFYVSTLTLLEQARQEAAKTQRYLAISVRPGLAEEPLEPRRAWAVLTVIACSLIGYLVLGIAYKTVKEHVV